MKKTIGKLFFLYFLFISVASGLVLQGNWSEKGVISFAYGIGILTFSIGALLLLGWEIFGRDLTGYLNVSSKALRWVVVLLSSAKFLVMGGLLWWGLGVAKFEVIPLSLGALASLIAFGSAVCMEWFLRRRGECFSHG